MTAPADAFATLQAAERDGRLERIADEHGLGLVVVFGSAARADSAARDLDVAVSARPPRGCAATPRNAS